MRKPWLLHKVTSDASCHPSAKSRQRSGRNRHMLSSCYCSSSSSGCMNTIFHLFHQPSFISKTFINSTPQEHTIIHLKGVQAPRNSLELEEQEPMVEESASSSSKLKQETNFNIPMGTIQIYTKTSTLLEDVSCECSITSPGTKTPNLVARLMGLDLLPDQYSSPRSSLTSPRPSSSSTHATTLNLNHLSKLSSYKNNARSLPATPRISTTSRRSAEIDHKHRLSLQMIDERTNEYAKQIAKQVRENIKRRVGVDITNTVKKREQRRDDHLVVLKAKRPSPPLAIKSKKFDQGRGRGKENALIPLSCSSRLRSSNIETNLKKHNSNTPRTSQLSSCSKNIKVPLISATTKSPPMKVQKCKRIAGEKYDLRLKKVHRQEEQVVKKFNKKSTPLSTNLVNVNTTTKFLSLQKDIVSPLLSILPQKQRGQGRRTQMVGGIAFEEEVEEMVAEIERDVVDTLVDEMVGIIWHGGCGSMSK